MTFLSVAALPLILLFLVLALVGLIGFPLRPNSWVFTAFWGLGFLTLASIITWPAKGFGWHPPVWQQGVALAFLAVPYGTSLYFWLRRRRKTRPLSDVTVGTVVFVVALASALALRWYNTSCVFFTYHHDHGESWCATSWQAKLTNR